MAGSTGKRGRAVELGTTSTTWKYEAEQQDGIIGSTDTISPVTTITTEFNIVNLFSIGANKEIEEIETTKVTRPFIHQVRFHGPQGEIIRMAANIDDGAMKEVMSSSVKHKVKHRLGTILPSSQLLRVGSEMEREGRGKRS